MTTIKDEKPAPYGGKDHLPAASLAAIEQAKSILMDQLRKPGKYITQPIFAVDLAKLELARDVDEAFCCIWLDNRHGVIAFDRIFHGTIDGASVYPRVIVRKALEHNAAAVVLVHNHPSGNPEPSQADERITKRLQDALALIDVRVLDHIVVGGLDHVSLAERGLI